VCLEYKNYTRLHGIRFQKIVLFPSIEFLHAYRWTDRRGEANGFIFATFYWERTKNCPKKHVKGGLIGRIGDEKETRGSEPCRMNGKRGASLCSPDKKKVKQRTQNLVTTDQGPKLPTREGKKCCRQQRTFVHSFHFSNKKGRKLGIIRLLPICSGGLIVRA
jgi:hypothetical protein